MQDRETIELQELTGQIALKGLRAKDARIVDLSGDYQVVWTYAGERHVEELRVRFMRKCDRDEWIEKLRVVLP